MTVPVAAAIGLWMGTKGCPVSGCSQCQHVNRAGPEQGRLRPTQSYLMSHLDLFPRLVLLIAMQGWGKGG